MARKRKDEQPDAPQAQASVPRELIPDTVEYAEAKRKRDDDHMNELQRSFAENAAKAVAVPGQPTENVLVVKTSERAAQQEQARIDEGKQAAANQQPEPPPEPPPEEGTVPEWVNPKHPFVPNALGSAPHSATMPAGPMGEHIVYVTDDIEADGTPLIEGAAEGVHESDYALNGYTNTRTTDIDPNWQHHPADADADKSEPKINRHSVEGAGVEQMKLQRDVVFVPKDEAQGAGGPGGY